MTSTQGTLSSSGSSSIPRVPTSSRATRSTGPTGRSTRIKACGGPSPSRPEGWNLPVRRRESTVRRRGAFNRRGRKVGQKHIRKEGNHGPGEDQRQDEQERRGSKQP